MQVYVVSVYFVNDTFDSDMGPISVTKTFDDAVEFIKHEAKRRNVTLSQELNQFYFNQGTCRFEITQVAADL